MKYITPLLLAIAIVVPISSRGQSDFNCIGDCVPSITPDTPTGSCYALTPDEKRKVGAVWSTCPLAITESFIVAASLYLGGKSKGGADGMGFVIQNSGPSILGHHGGGMGMKGIAPSVGVEFDTFHNTRDTMVADHIAVVRDGRVFTRIVDGPFAFPGNQEVEDGAFHDVMIEWENSTMTLNVYWEGSSTALISTHVDLVSIFGSSAYVGFTASTGNKTNVHEVCVQSIMGTCVETVAPSVSTITTSPSIAPSFSTTAPVVLVTVAPIVAPVLMSPTTGTSSPTLTSAPSAIPSALSPISLSESPSAAPSTEM